MIQYCSDINRWESNLFTVSLQLIFLVYLNTSCLLPVLKVQFYSLYCLNIAWQLLLKVSSPTHYRRMWRGLALSRRGVCCFLGWLALQDITLLDHLEVAVLARDVAVLQGYEDGLAILPLEPILRLDGTVWSCRVWVQVILEQVRLQSESGTETAVRERCTKHIGPVNWTQIKQSWMKKHSLWRFFIDLAFLMCPVNHPIIFYPSKQTVKCGIDCWNHSYFDCLDQNEEAHLSGHSHDDRLTLPFMQFIKPANIEAKISILFTTSHNRPPV